MLFTLGSVEFEVAPVNPTDTSFESGGTFVEKPVMGRRPPLEFVGPSGETFKISVKLFPDKLGGMSSLDMLKTIRLSGVPQFLQRGDGTPLGWMVLEQISENHSYLNARGVGQVIDVSISLRRADAPADTDFFASVMGIFT